MTMPRVAVLGSGALGSVYGAALVEAGCDVTLLARRHHVSAIRERGLVIRERERARTIEVEATSDPASVPQSEIVLVTAKVADTRSVLDAVTWIPDIVASVQNGAAKDEILVERFGDAVVGCVSTVGATVRESGVVDVTSPGPTYLGRLTMTRPWLPEELAGLLDDGGLETEIRSDIEAVTWTKAALSVAAMGAAGSTRLLWHRVFLNRHAAGLFLDLLREAAAIITAEGGELVDLPGRLALATLAAAPRSEALEMLEELGHAMEAAGRTEIRSSVLQSIESGRRTEVEAIHGDMLNRARRREVAVPVMTTVAAILRALDEEVPTP